MKYLMDGYKEIISVKNNVDIIRVEFDFYDNYTFTKDFLNEKKIITFMEKEYYILKCKYLEDIRKELNKKIDNQRKELFNLNKAYSKTKIYKIKRDNPLL